MAVSFGVTSSPGRMAPRGLRDLQRSAKLREAVRAWPRRPLPTQAKVFPPPPPPQTEEEALQRLLTLFDAVHYQITHIDLSTLAFEAGKTILQRPKQILVREEGLNKYEIFSLGRFQGKVWEIHFLDGQAMPVLDVRTSRRMYLLTGRGFITADETYYEVEQPLQYVDLPKGTAHGFACNAMTSMVMVSVTDRSFKDVAQEQPDYPKARRFRLPGCITYGAHLTNKVVEL